MGSLMKKINTSKTFSFSFTIANTSPVNIYLLKVNDRYTSKKVQNMFKNKNKSIGAASSTSFWSIYCFVNFELCFCFEFEQINV